MCGEAETGTGRIGGGCCASNEDVLAVSSQSSKRRSGTGQPRSAITWMGLFSAIGTFFALVIGTYKYTRAVALHAALEIKLPGKSFSLQQQPSVLRYAVWLYETLTPDSSVLHPADYVRS